MVTCVTASSSPGGKGDIIDAEEGPTAGAAACWQRPAVGGGKEIRTPDIQLAKLALYQLSYTPRLVWWAYLDSNQRPPAYQAGALTN